MNRTAPEVQLDSAVRLLDVVNEAVRQFALESLSERMGVTRRLLQNPSQIGVAVLGGFKAGKLGFDWLWPLIPLALVRPLFRRHLSRRLAWEAEKNLSRLAAQWGDGLERSVGAGGATTRQHLERQRQTLVRMCESAENLIPAMMETRGRLIRELDGVNASGRLHA